MSLAAFAMDALLALLLVAALGVGLRLNVKLTLLRTGQANFVRAVGELDAAAMRAEAGLSALRAATLDAHDHLLDRIEAARTLADRLERIVGEAEITRAQIERAAADVPAQPSPPASPRTAPPRTPAVFASTAAADPDAPGAALARFVARRERHTAGRPA